MPCNFCSMDKMYGKSFRMYSIDRVIEDIEDAKNHGAGQDLGHLHFLHAFGDDQQDVHFQSLEDPGGVLRFHALVNLDEARDLGVLDAVELGDQALDGGVS